MSRERSEYFPESYKILKFASNEITELIKAKLKEYNIDIAPKVLISEKEFYEEDIMSIYRKLPEPTLTHHRVSRGEILGYYDDKDNVIVISLGMALKELRNRGIDDVVERLINTLAHELIHFFQYNNISTINSIRIHVQRDDMISSQHMMLYENRPY